MSKPSQKSRPQKTGRKPSAPRKTRAGHPGATLRRALGELVTKESKKIARAVVNQTIAGNMTGARIITALTDAENPPAPKKRKRRGLSEAERLALEPSWDDTPPEEQKRILIASRMWCFECDGPSRVCEYRHLPDPE
jgi:hypothetical protein